jgi:hypothetical protein
LYQAIRIPVRSVWPAISMTPPSMRSPRPLTTYTEPCPAAIRCMTKPPFLNRDWLIHRHVWVRGIESYGSHRAARAWHRRHQPANLSVGSPRAATSAAKSAPACG